ncbi:MAG: hypothetical protein ABIO49_10020 [Dokdonella sp.]
MDAEENKALFVEVGKLQMPLLAIGGELSYDAATANKREAFATHVQCALLRGSGHWIMEEQSDQAREVIVAFVAR